MKNTLNSYLFKTMSFVTCSLMLLGLVGCSDSSRFEVDVDHKQVARWSSIAAGLPNKPKLNESYAEVKTDSFVIHVHNWNETETDPKNAGRSKKGDGEEEPPISAEAVPNVKQSLTDVSFSPQAQHRNQDTDEEKEEDENKDDDSGSEQSGVSTGSIELATDEPSGANNTQPMKCDLEHDRVAQFCVFNSENGLKNDLVARLWLKETATELIAIYDKHSTASDKSSFYNKSELTILKINSGFPHWIRIVSDEEATAAWFVKLLDSDRGENSKPNIDLNDSAKKQLTSFLATAIKYRLNGIDDSKSPDKNDESTKLGQGPVPNLLTFRLRWEMWVFGTDSVGAYIQLLIYAVAVFGIVVFAVRLPWNWQKHEKLIWFRLCSITVFVIVSAVLVALLAFISGKPEKATWEIGALVVLALIGMFVGWFSPCLKSIEPEVLKKLMRLDNWATWILDSLPSLGFVGTIYGLGSAFGAVGIISDMSLVKKQALMEVLLNLSTAFSTTFWALVLGLFVKTLFAINHQLGEVEYPILVALPSEQNNGAEQNAS